MRDKNLLVTTVPLEVIKKRPQVVSTHVHAVHVNGEEHLLQIFAMVLDSAVVIQRSMIRDAVFGDVYRWIAVFPCYFAKQDTEAFGCHLINMRST